MSEEFSHWSSVASSEPTPRLSSLLDEVLNPPLDRNGALAIDETTLAFGERERDEAIASFRPRKVALLARRTPGPAKIRSDSRRRRHLDSYR